MFDTTPSNASKYKYNITPEYITTYGCTDSTNGCTAGRQYTEYDCENIDTHATLATKHSSTTIEVLSWTAWTLIYTTSLYHWRTVRIHSNTVAAEDCMDRGVTDIWQNTRGGTFLGDIRYASIFFGLKRYL